MSENAGMTGSGASTAVTSFIMADAIDYDGNNFLDSIFLRAADLPVVPICRS
jgi:hypothetical protein